MIRYNKNEKYRTHGNHTTKWTAQNHRVQTLESKKREKFQIYKFNGTCELSCGLLLSEKKLCMLTIHHIATVFLENIHFIQT